MLVPYPKPHLSIRDQLALLKSRGMVVADEPRAERYLERLGYYRLSGYWYPARIVTTATDVAGNITYQVQDTFRTGTTFEHAVELYVFDKRLRLLFLDAIERIEVSLRVEASLLLSTRNPIAHRDPNQLHGNFAKKTNPHTGRTRHQEWLARLDESTARSKEDFVQRFQSKYSSPLPMWIAIELWDFGALSHFISGMRYGDTNTLAAKYGIPRAELLTSWVRTLNHVRNVSAHHSRLWKSALPGELANLDHLFSDRHAQNRVYAAAAITQHFMRTVIPHSTWPARFKSLAGSFPPGPGFDLRQAGFPPGWENLPLWN